jgi:superfamily II DNA or RNA helicase
MTEESSQHFNPLLPRAHVQLCANPAKRGVTTGRTKVQGTRTFVQVEFGPNERRYIDTEDLEPVTLADQDIASLLLDRKFGHKGELARVLTYYKVSSRLDNIFYAMHTSRTDFYAYQFKPVYKFIESANGRILIADEVGLGKTIEAGLIWQEVRARTGATRLLVICPSMLREKWKRELRARFDVRAEIYDSKGFRTLLEDFERETWNFRCAAVCSLEGLRRASVLEAIDRFSESDNTFDLVVIDEAHYMRNSETKAHQLGQHMSSVTENLVMLTATPLHLKNEDLYRLLNVLDQDEYSNLYLFESRMKANEPVVVGQNALRRIPVNLAAARESVYAMASSSWFQNNPLTELAVAKIDKLDDRSHSDLVEASRLLEDLNLLSATVSRTRKREVQEWRVIREARVLDLEFTPYEMDFYNAVTEAVRKRVSLHMNDAFEALILMMPQRQMASCIPAMVEYYRASGEFDRSDSESTLDEDLGWEIEAKEQDEGPGQSLSPELITVIRKWRADYPDSKYDALMKELRKLFSAEPAAKVVVFSYFKRTLAYLERRLTEDGYAPGVIHGDVPMDDRQAIIDRVETRPDCRVLLSSEVGSEGLDLQFCRIVVNYDLPWNPMKVEQRIGRVDRLGQKSDKVTIINLSASGTIEARILERLYRRIGIFEHSIGDLEPILGDMVQKLTLDLLSSDLTPEQEEARIEQTRRALEEKRKQEAELEDKSSLFFGSSDFILEQITDARKAGRWITPSDVRSYVSDFFQNHYPGTRIGWDRPESGLVSISLSNAARSDLSSFCRAREEWRTQLVHQGTEPIELLWSKEPVVDLSGREMLSHFHPLVRWITESYKIEETSFFPTSAVEVKTAIVSPGSYLFLIELWRFIAAQESVQIAYGAVPLSGGQPLDASLAELLLQEILSTGQSWANADSSVTTVETTSALDRCNADLARRREAAAEIFQRKTLAAAERRVAHLEAHLARREESFNRGVEKLENELTSLRTFGESKSIADRKAAIERRLKGERTKIENLRQKVDDQVRQLKKSSESRFEIDEVAGGICRVIA